MVDPRTDIGFLTHVAEERFQVMAQPIFSVSKNMPIHEEWLVRFDTDIKLLSVMRPAEISGAIAYLDLAMINKAVALLNSNPNRLPVAVNISGASMEDSEFKAGLKSAISAYKSNPNRLIFELTETWNLNHLDQAAEILNMISRAGHPTCLDDVGAGAASIRYLRAFETDWLKIDGEFIVAAMNSKRELAILEAILNLKSSLGVKFIAEGIENQALFNFAKSLKFEAVQGFMLGRPLSLNT